MARLQGRRLLPVLLCVIVCAVVLGACGSSSSKGAPTETSKPATTKLRTLSVTLTPEGCKPIHLSTPAGPTRFVVTNDDAPALSELVLLDGSILVAEVEGVKPGTGERTFSVTLQPGHYLLSCPGGTVDAGQGSLDVTGDPVQVAKADAKQRAISVATYRRFLEGQAQLLVELTTVFAQAVEAGDKSPSPQAIDRAKGLYAPARAPYERIEPVAEAFGDLDPRIDARVNDVASGQPWTGFHRIEQALYEKGDLTGMAPIAQQLVADVNRLNEHVKTVPLEPATIANGAVELLNEVTSTKITGEEERYSHIDLVDVAANVTGSRAAFDSVAPLLPADAGVSAGAIDARFDDVLEALKPYRKGDGFVLYTTLTELQTRAISQRIDAVAEPLSQVAELVIA
jgi:iron uptake system component EfeO